MVSAVCSGVGVPLELNTTKVYKVKGCFGQGSVKAFLHENDTNDSGKCLLLFGAS